jgi:hypothetical protein
MGRNHKLSQTHSPENISKTCMNNKITARFLSKKGEAE